MGRWISSCLIVIAAMTLSLMGPFRASAAPPPLRPVVSYFVSTGPDSSVRIPEESAPIGPLPPHPWQWRVFDPASGRDALFLRLGTLPRRVRWSPDFSFVEYVVGNQIERAQWRPSAPPPKQISMPADTAVCDFWSDPGGMMHVVTQHEIWVERNDGRRSRDHVATRWDRDVSGKWLAAAVDTVDSHYGECQGSARLQQGAPRAEAVQVKQLLDSMRLAQHHDSTLSEDPARGDAFSGWVWVASDLDPSIGLEMRAGHGDSFHAMEPVVWVNRELGRRETVYASGESQNEALGQLAFGERAGFMLLASEFSGACPEVVDMRSGRVLFQVKGPSAWAVWVEAPRDWRY